MLKIGINAHLLSGSEGYRRAGIHHYISQVLAHLPSQDDLCYALFSQQTSLAEARPDMTPITSRWPTGRRWARILWEQSVWPLAAARSRLDLIHSMAFALPLLRPCPAIATIYDLSFIHYPESFPALQRLYLTTMTRHACRVARRVVAISESGRDDIHCFFGVPLSRIDVVRPGVDAVYAPRPVDEVEAFRIRRGLPPRFVLHVGTLQPRKNIPVLLEAMARLPAALANVPLVLVGGKGWLYDEIFQRVNTLGLQGRVHFAGYVADEDLPLWYNAASILVLPSVYEGFGLPIVEALACGTPVVAANVSALPEAAGNAGLLFEPQDVDMLATHLTTLLSNSEVAATMRARGLAQVQHFSWERSGKEMLTTYRTALTVLS